MAYCWFASFASDKNSTSKYYNQVFGHTTLNCRKGIDQPGLYPSAHLLFLSLWYISASFWILFQDSLHAVAIGGSKLIFLVFVTSKYKISASSAQDKRCY